MRSWSQPTESTCGLGCSGEVKRLWVWTWAVLKSQSFLSPNRVWLLLFTPGDRADTAPPARTTGRTGLPGTRPARLSSDRLELRSRGVGTFHKKKNVRKVQAISREHLVALPVGEPIYDVIVNAVN